MGIPISPDRLPAALKRRAKATPDVLRKGLYLAAQRGRTLLVRRSPVDRGNYKNAWQVHKRPGGAEIENSAPYAGIIELGARAHPVSREGRESILGWVRRHFPAADEKEAQRIANAICWKIQTKPTKGKFVVRSSMDNLYRFLHAEVMRQLKKHAKDASP